MSQLTLLEAKQKGLIGFTYVRGYSTKEKEKHTKTILRLELTDQYGEDHYIYIAARSCIPESYKGEIKLV